MIDAVLRPPMLAVKKSVSDFHATSPPHPPPLTRNLRGSQEEILLSLLSSPPNHLTQTSKVGTCLYENSGSG